MRKALILANGFRLQYRSLRCAAPLFEAVEVYGTAEAKALSRSTFCQRFHARQPQAQPFGTVADVEAINRILADENISYILPSDADTTRFLAEHRTAIAATCYPVPTVETFDTLNDKARFAQFCVRHHLPHPASVVCEGVDQVRKVLAAADPDSSFVVKPLAMWGSLGVAKITNATAEPVLRSLDYSPILLQNYIAGTEFTTVALARAGCLANVAHYRRDDGAVTFFDHAEATQLASQVASSLSYDGIMVFDVRVDEAGQLFLIECNPRFWYRMDVAMRAGANFIEFGLWPDRSREKGLFPIRPVRLDGARIILNHLLRPWEMTAGDRAFIRFALSDPLPVALTLISRFKHLHQAASGHQL
ncbi:ATP-grasp domain-containing protein [Bosea lathyri]|uniref:ATP-grasp domain-containing protein n=1 Tax=Bosea lathyri TaxID=1036778 RepID=A0A1H5YYD5_9HYPH|nr:ATP-grasp domain-containing protein [Bosea lathyri]SEG29058.1 ATP-grasp domain-containing protein [Bosea lathyri]